MNKHTPGPWTAISDPLHFYSLTTIIAGNVVRGTPQVRIDVGGKVDIAELEANARLIAAAPDLLEALINAHQFITNGIEHGYILRPDADTPDTAHQTPEIIRTAIAKSRG